MTGSMGPYTFISFSRDPWNNVWLNRQHIMSRLTREHRALFCSRTPRWQEVWWKLRLREPIRWRSRTITPNLIDFRPWPWTPRVHEWPDLDRSIEKLHVARIRTALHRHGWDNRITYIWHPEMVRMAGRFSERLTCFHCYDDYAGYSWLDEAARRVTNSQIARLVDTADLVFAAGDAMRETLPRADVLVVPNGVDYELYSTARTLDEPPPADLARIPQPIVAHVGRLHMSIDFALLAEIARRRRNWSVLVLGPVPGPYPPEQQAAYDAFVREPNAYRIDGRPVVELPRYLRHVRVTLMAYQVMPWTRRIFPLKLFEYLAAGKPCVGPPLDELVRRAGYVTIVETVDEWIAAIEHWLANDSEVQATKRMALAKANSWDVRCRQILRAVAEKLGDPLPGDEAKL
ncbi:MAG: glycosyltransferase [Verrucomicrobia bacterium]|nr:glycosyltransferase [Verrucomicrobiota bacterium]